MKYITINRSKSYLKSTLLGLYRIYDFVEKLPNPDGGARKNEWGKLPQEMVQKMTRQNQYKQPGKAWELGWECCQQKEKSKERKEK